MPEPSMQEVLAGLLQKLDSLNLEGQERALMWAILAAARDSVRLAEPQQGMSFQNEFADAFTPGPAGAHVDLPTRFTTSFMIVK